ncbi:bifunctional folylpolyglutamate synthase/dihydrofolate synthase [Sphingomonas immobilis]|uniref:Dihydrofolate synthase/folylpolyglutamate synthase n=1 Tax=Sphingomonas immobilis TaxID=3063997 RepID=A0ABT8ZZL3_9SPHN|nr:folylpolyglutamate synthase/dihydrofolate synthase family protein [Sphingomonas sp. CA1-15]MDO7842642.1 folylpolyglutamate synthase/dihydrofolate synthase family protein [Sphingomonas sp. CA1-15]
MDSATSSAPAVQAQLDRLWALSPGADILGLERITALLARLGDPHLRLPPVLHVAGTNGKGSTCAFLRAAIEAAGLTCHVYTSPHLVRFNERIRIAGTLIDDDTLAALLSEVLDHAGDIGASFFEVTTAAAFLAFSRTPADACVIEVGLGGRLDATNVIPAPLVTGIAQLGIDHQSFLGDTALEIAGEKAGIAKPGVPLLTMAYPPDIAARVAEVAAKAGAVRTEWRHHIVGPAGAGAATLHGEPGARHATAPASAGATLVYEDARGTVETPLPRMAGPHQPGNLALAIAMLRHQSALAIPPQSFTAAATGTTWPARMQHLAPGPLAAMLPPGSQLWLDGGHNPAAAGAIAATLEQIAHPGTGRSEVHLILGMLSNKDPAGLLAPFAGLATTLHAVPVPDHAHHAPADLAATARALGIAAHTAADVPGALADIVEIADQAEPPIVLILGSLYLAGEVLRANDEIPD